MDKAQINNIVEAQREYFYGGNTLSINSRISALVKLKKSILKHEQDINQALKEDLGKSKSEAYMCEVGMVLSELSHMLKHVKAYSREKTVVTPLAQFHSRSYVKPSPYGVVLIMSPWNYPFMLTMDPLIDAIAAGNTAVVKPSAYSPATSEVIKTILEECYSPEFVAVITGGRAENTCLLEEHFDYIFFTGSQAVGKEVMRSASEHLTPVTLELGGKSPCIVDASANIMLAAKRIVFGKLLNCGQTCVAPDYIYCDEAVKNRLVAAIKMQISRQYGIKPLKNENYGKIINKKHFNRIIGLIDKEKVVYGGAFDEEALKITPTVMDNVSFEDAVMQEEIFGPVLPVLTFENLDEAISRINRMPHPLAAYMFSSDAKNIQKFTKHLGFGGGCINDTIIHLATSAMGFGGFGESGMGSYHGKAGFDTFSHHKSIVDKKTWIDLPLRYQPYSEFYDKLIRMFVK